MRAPTTNGLRDEDSTTTNQMYHEMGVELGLRQDPSEEQEFVQARARKKFRSSNKATKKYKEPPSWADPKSEDWDTTRVLEDDDFLAPDYLVEKPSFGFVYVKGEKLVNPDKYDWTKDEDENYHPRLLQYMGKGTDTPILHDYYKFMPHDTSIPFAGIARKEEEENQDNKETSEARALHDDVDDFSNVLFPKLRRRSNIQSQEDNFYTRPSIKLVMPDHIKATLVDDWENVTKNQQLVPLPARPTVNEILDKYKDDERAKRMPGSPEADILEEVIDGLKSYFEMSLGRVLLYKFERPQYIDFRKASAEQEGDFAGKSAGDVYGIEHLCRLLVTLPELVAQTNMDMQSVNRLREELTKFTTWLGKNSPQYFVKEYVAPNPQYVERARGVA